MNVIRDRNGNIIQRSQNLAGIRRYVGKHAVKVLSITGLQYEAGKLCILFENGASYETNFASFDVLRDFVARWRNVYGAPLIVNGVACGVVGTTVVS